MFILKRLISRSSRALGVMLGTSRRGAGHAQGGRESDPVPLWRKEIPE
jgi:hypothetical protein